ncbi:MAG: glycosyltransferase family 2 protein [Bacteroides sp.]
MPEVGVSEEKVSEVNASEVKVSVIVPVYNTEKYIPRCIASILAQTLKDIEVIIVDDGSSDNSYGVCEEYAKRDGRIRLFGKKNGGASSARNMALDKASGQYISFVDSDDYIEENALEVAYNAIKAENADMAVYGTDYAYDLKEDEKKAVSDGKYDIISYDNRMLMENYLTDRGFYIGTILWNKMFSASVWKQRRLKEGIMNEDADVMYEIIGNTEKAVCITKPLYIQCVRMGSVTNRRFHKGRMNRLNIATKTKAYVRENYDETMYGYAVFEAGNVCRDMLKEMIAADPTLARREARADGNAKLARTDGNANSNSGVTADSDGDDLYRCYKELIEYYRKNNEEMKKYKSLDYKKYIRIMGCYVLRKYPGVISKF